MGGADGVDLALFLKGGGGVLLILVEPGRFRVQSKESSTFGTRGKVRLGGGTRGGGWEGGGDLGGE